MKKNRSLLSKSIQELGDGQCILAILSFFLLGFVSMFCAILVDSIFTFPLILLFVACVLSAILSIFGFIQKKVQSAGPAVFAADIPDQETPAPSSKPKKAVPAAYLQRLDTLESLCMRMKEQMDSIDGFLDDYFENSILSSSRYRSIMNQALEVLQTNYQKARQAVGMFGTSTPTRKRIEILDGYVEDSRDVVSKMETIIDEMTRIQQTRVFSDSQPMDEMLDSLSSTTSRYQ